METALANVFEVQSSPGEISLLFGMIQAAVSGSSASLPARLDHRIILSPHIAKRFAFLLSRKIGDYEAVFGPLLDEVPTAAVQRSTLFPDDIQRCASPGTSAMAQALVRLIAGLDVECGLERSFKISEGSLLQHRFLIGFKKDDLPGDAAATVMSVFRQMGMPDRFRSDCLERLSGAEFVHFGFEEQGEGCLFKAYLEFKTNVKFGLDGAKVAQEPFTVFLGFKWNPFDSSKSALSRYTCYPLLTVAEIEEKLSCLFERNPAYKSFETARHILNKTVKVISTNKIIYEEVTEENNPRKSFDINLYGANLTIRDIYPFLMDIGRHYSLPAEQFSQLCAGISDKAFGHLSGGVDREGKDFLTIYYGVENISNRRPPPIDQPLP
jgi:hypothetical protein